MSELRTNWEDRANHFGRDLAGVLFRGLSPSANEAIHDWHSWVVREIFSPTLPLSANVLDLGCGYGRLSKVLVEERNDLSITGTDISLTYCQMYTATVGACVCTNMTRLPFSDASFEAVMAVTSLMYATSSAIEILKELSRITRPSGTILLLDPGIEMQRLIAGVRGRKAESPTGGQGFSKNQYLGMIDAAGFDVLMKGGNQTLSHALMLPGVGGARNRHIEQVLKWASRRDCTVSGYSTSALHRWALATRREGIA